nr:cucumisin [Quercus suber]
MRDYLLRNPEATIMVSEEIQDFTAPYAASFSSRGPNPITPDIPKSDLTAPGVNILAAWSPLSPASVYKEDTRSTKYCIDSGTSMACLHASGVAAYVKATHPSCICHGPNKACRCKRICLWICLLNPTKAVDPGLVFDASVSYYIDFLCKQGYNTSTLRLVTGEQSVCKSTKAGRGWDLNYPSLSLAIEDGQKISGIFTRTVKNVGSPNSTYHAKIDKPDSLNITVEPSVLSFSAVGDKKTFIVNFKGKHITQVPIVSGSISWIDGVQAISIC